MKKRNLFLLLTAILLVLFIVAFVTVYCLVLKDGEVPTDPPTAESSEEGTEKDAHELDHPTLLTNMSEYSLTAFTLNGHRYIKDENGEYYAEEFYDWPLDQKILAEMAIAFTQISSTYFVENSYGGPTYGFYTDDEPTFSIENELGDQIDIWIGNQCDLDDRYYAASSFEEGIYLIDFDKELLTYEPYNLLVLDSFYFFEGEQMQSLVLKDGEGESVYSTPHENGDPLDIWSFLGNMDISPSAVQAYAPGSAQLAEWGLDSAHALTAHVTFIDSWGTTREFDCRLGEVVTEGSSAQKTVYVQFERIVYLTYITDEAASVLRLLQNK